MISIFDDVATDSETTVTEGYHLLVNFVAQDDLAKQADEIVNHHHKIQCGLGGVETMQVKTVRTEIIFEFLDAIFSIGPLAIEGPDVFTG